MYIPVQTGYRQVYTWVRQVHTDIYIIYIVHTTLIDMYILDYH